MRAKSAFPAILIFTLLTPSRVFAQRLSGIIYDKNSGEAVIFATVSAGNFATVTSLNGWFTLNGLKTGDTLKVSCIGYKPCKTIYNGKDTITIFLTSSSILLKDVNIKAKRDFKQDSLNLRRQFPAVFNYHAPKLKDMFATVDPNVYVPYNYIDAPNNATQIVNVNLLSVISMLGKHKSSISKLQKTLLQDEEDTYVDRFFSKEKIARVTNLKGDSLRDFMNDYRPSIKEVKKMNDYQLIVYIRKSYAEFLKTYDPAKQLFSTR